MREGEVVALQDKFEKLNVQTLDEFMLKSCVYFADPSKKIASLTAAAKDFRILLYINRMGVLYEITEMLSLRFIESLKELLSCSENPEIKERGVKFAKFTIDYHNDLTLQQALLFCDEIAFDPSYPKAFGKYNMLWLEQCFEHFNDKIIEARERKWKSPAVVHEYAAKLIDLPLLKQIK